MTTSYPSRGGANPFGSFRPKAPNSVSGPSPRLAGPGLRKSVTRPKFRVLKRDIVENKTVLRTEPFTFIVERQDSPDKPTFKVIDSPWSTIGNTLYEVKFVSNSLATSRASTLDEIERYLHVHLKTPSDEPRGSEAFNVLRDEILEFLTKKLAEAVDLLGQKLTPVASTALSAAVPNDPLAAARARGVTYMKAQLELPENINLDTAAEYSGLSGRHINELRQRGELYALVLEGNTRGFRYPQWQFDAEFERLAPVLKALKQKSLSCWAIHDFLTRSNEDLGRSPKEGILDASFPLERIEQAIERRFGRADQGAT